MEYIYLDNNATTKVEDEAVEVMLPFYKEMYANPSSQHSFAQESKTKIEEARETIADLFKINTSELIFTGSATESNNMAIRGIAKAYKNKGKHIITSCVEHPAVLNTCKALEEEGYKITYLPVNKDGEVSITDLKNAITNETILITIMYANNEIGTIMPIEEIGKIAKENKIFFHVDAVQVIGKIKFYPKEIGIDLLTFTAHKFYGPKAVGTLFIKNGIKLSKIMFGGHHERNRRPSTESPALICGMTKALEIAYENMEEEQQREVNLRDYFEEQILKQVPECFINAKNAKRTAGTSSITFKYIEGESILLSLDMHGICVSSGSACSAGDLVASHVILGIGVPIEHAQGTIRFSLGRYNTKNEINKVIEVLPKIIENLRKMSPLYKQTK